MQLEDFVKKAIEDRYVGWELIEFLDVSIEEVLSAALDNEWINDDNVAELLESMGYDRED